VNCLKEQTSDKKNMFLRKDKMQLLESEEKYLARLKRNVEKAHVLYIGVGLSWAVSFVGFLVGVLYDRQDHFLAMLFFAWVGISLLLTVKSQRTVNGIIVKLQNRIREMEQTEKS
jgi:hypothetical protein